MTSICKLQQYINTVRLSASCLFSPALALICESYWWTRTLCVYFIWLTWFFFIRLCVCSVISCASDVWLDHAQQGFVPGRLHRDWQQPPPCHRAADPAQPLRYELHGKTHTQTHAPTDPQQEVMLFRPLGVSSPCPALYNHIVIALSVNF